MKNNEDINENKNDIMKNNQENIEDINLKNNNHHSTNYDDEPFIKKDHQGLKTFIIMVIILLLLGGASLFYYFKIYNSPILVIGNIINSTKNSFKIPNTKNINAYKVSGALDLDLSFNDKEAQKLADIINDIKLQYNLSIDTNNNYGIMELHSKYQNDKLLNLKAILDNEDETAYIYLEDLFDKYLKTTIDVTDVTNETTNNETINYEIIITGIYNALSNAITEEDFERASDETNINGKITKVYRNSLVINQSNYKRIMTTIIKELRDNEEFITEINKLNNNEDIKDTLNEALNEINESTYEDIIKINFYTKPSLKQELLKLEIVETSEDGNYNIAFTNTNKTNLTIDFTKDNEQIATLNINRNSDTNMIINCKFNTDGNEIKFSLNMSYKELNKIEKINTTQNIDINNLTEDDTTKIITNLTENEVLLKLINDIKNIFSISM